MTKMISSTLKYENPFFWNLHVRHLRSWLSFQHITGMRCSARKKSLPGLRSEDRWLQNSFCALRGMANPRPAITFSSHGPLPATPDVCSMNQKTLHVQRVERVASFLCVRRRRLCHVPSKAAYLEKIFLYIVTAISLALK
ncbi:hypothetical protein AVEN_140680-1 [Araneus ventricosus]|uniref:Uncharacterized protein n=1 Tax=Araneus ventricosus TaxID=182803 RepID=A0A4Y2C625_ARAVE|nr:hypothetical protein AVEN_140680-1 [Araneus ventricosus]